MKKIKLKAYKNMEDLKKELIDIAILTTLAIISGIYLYSIHGSF